MDPTVTTHCAREIATPVRSTTVADTPDGTAVTIGTASAQDLLTIHVLRILAPGEQDDRIGTGSAGHVRACWRLPDGAEARSLFLVVH